MKQYFPDPVYPVFSRFLVLKPWFSGPNGNGNSGYPILVITYAEKLDISSFVFFKVVSAQKKREETGKNRTNQIREVLFHGPKLYGDCIMVFGKRSSCLHGYQWAADSAALPLDVDMAGALSGGETKIFDFIYSGILL